MGEHGEKTKRREETAIGLRLEQRDEGNIGSREKGEGDRSLAESNEFVLSLEHLSLDRHGAAESAMRNIISEK